MGQGHYQMKDARRRWRGKKVVEQVFTRVPQTTHIISFLSWESQSINLLENKKMKGSKRPIHAVTTWVRRQPPKMKAFLAVLSGLAALLFLRIFVHDHDSLFVAAELVHALGISVLIYKLTREKTCAGTFQFLSFSQNIKNK